MPDAPAAFGRLTPILVTEDMDSTIAFYRDILGFKVTSQMPDENPTWCFMARDEAAIMFTTPEEPDHDHDEDENHGHEHGHDHDHEPLDSSGANRLWTMYIYSDDVEALWKELEDRTKIAYPLYDTHYGMREFGLRDRDGYMLSFGKDI